MIIVSIITSVFNADEYIEFFLKNITEQTIFNKCELILMNICNSHKNNNYINDIIMKYKKKFINIVVYNIDKDPGIYEVWNNAIKISKGKYITNANLDDRRDKKHIEKLINFFDDDTLLVCSQCYAIKKNNKMIWFKNIPKYFDIKNMFISKNNIIKSVNPPHAAPIWKKILHDKYGYFDEKTYGTYADYELWLRVLSDNNKFKLFNEPLYEYLINPTSHGRINANNTLFNKIINIYHNII